MNIEFQLKAELKCSGSLSDAVSSSDLTEFVKYCNEGVLKKGAPPGCGAGITWWDVALCMRIKNRSKK